MISLYYAVEPSVAWTRKLEKVAWVFFYSNVVFFDILGVLYLIWLILWAVDLEESRDIQDLLPPLDNAKIIYYYVLPTLGLLALRILLFPTIYRAIHIFYESTLLSGNYKSNIHTLPQINKEHRIRIEDKIEDARVRKGLSTVNETLNETANVDMTFVFQSPKINKYQSQTYDAKLQADLFVTNEVENQVSLEKTDRLSDSDFHSIGSSSSHYHAM